MSRKADEELIRQAEIAAHNLAVHRGQMYMECAIENMVALIGIDATFGRLYEMHKILKEFE